MDDTETIINIKNRIYKIKDEFYIRDIQSTDIFECVQHFIVETTKSPNRYPECVRQTIYSTNLIEADNK